MRPCPRGRAFGPVVLNAVHAASARGAKALHVAQARMCAEPESHPCSIPSFLKSRWVTPELTIIDHAPEGDAAVHDDAFMRQGADGRRPGEIDVVTDLNSRGLRLAPVDLPELSEGCVRLESRGIGCDEPTNTGQVWIGHVLTIASELESRSRSQYGVAMIARFALRTCERSVDRSMIHQMKTPSRSRTPMPTALSAHPPHQSRMYAMPLPALPR